MYGYTPMTCPQCGRRLVLKRVGHGFINECSFCDAKVGIASSYVWHLTALSFLLVALVGVSTYSIERRGTWLLCLMLLIAPIRFFLRAMIRPWFTFAARAHRSGFLGCFFAALFTIYLVNFVGIGWLQQLVGASRVDTQENLEMLSIPIAMIRSQFVITPKSSFLDLTGVLSANALFYSVLMLVCWKLASHALNRSAVTQMNLSANQLGNDDP